MTSNSDQNRIDARSFWDAKIARWERDRYDLETREESWFEKIANRTSMSVRFRLKAGEAIVAAACKGKHVVDLGCGSGRLALPLIRAGVASYRGFDIAPSAIEEARRRAQELGIADRAWFDVAEIFTMADFTADIVVSLGLLDWLTDEEIAAAFAKSGKADCLHAFSEERDGFQQRIHKFYVRHSYGWRTGAYVPRYLDSEWMRNIAERNVGRTVRVYRDRRLSFGIFLTTLQPPASLQFRYP